MLDECIEKKIVERYKNEEDFVQSKIINKV